MQNILTNNDDINFFDTCASTPLDCRKNSYNTVYLPAYRFTL